VGKAKGREKENGQAVIAPPDPSQPQPQAAARATEAKAGEGQRLPLRVFSYPVARGTFVQASVWDRQVLLPDGGSVTSYDVTVRKCYQDAAADGAWRTVSSFRGAEVYVLLHALQQASDFILEEKANAAGTPC
jgi:hypothetical protein